MLGLAAEGGRERLQSVPSVGWVGVGPDPRARVSIHVGSVEEIYMRHSLFILMALACLAVGLGAQLDLGGNLLVPGSGGGDGTPGTKLKEVKQKCFGVTFDRDRLYVLSGSQILELDTTSGAIKKTIMIAGLPSGAYPFGLGWDSTRKEFVVGETSKMAIFRVDMSGKITTQTSTATATHRNVGAAYDSCQDGYWITSWSTNTMILYDAATWKPRTTINLTTHGISRAAGTAYGAENHVVYTNSRGTKKGYVFDAGTGNLLYSYPLVYSGGNNGQGAGWWHRWQCPVVQDYETTLVTWTDAGLPRVQTAGSATTVSIGKALGIIWESGKTPSMPYLAVASFSEGWIFLQKCRYVPLALDPLFFLTAPPNKLPGVFQNFSGVLSTSGAAKGGVVAPNSAGLVGVSFSVAMVVVDAKAPSGIAAISGAWRLTITR